MHINFPRMVLKAQEMNIPKQNKPIQYLRNNIFNFKRKAAGTNLFEIQSWLADEVALERYHKNIKKEQELYTLLSPEKSKKVSSFFYAPKVHDSNGVEAELVGLLDKKKSSGILITGRLGQGKSVLLRYLQFLELNTGTSLPIFIELRKVKQATRVKEAACEKLNNMGLECSGKLFDFLLSEGHVSLFLDGFDEISLEERSGFSDYLSGLRERNPDAKILVTSRLNTELVNNPKFERYTIKKMGEHDIAPFVKTILVKETEHNPILSKITESDEFDYEVLDTPLMITWFILVYKKRLKIPKVKLGFYEDLFVAILSRHDGLKDSYNRPSKTKLSDDEIKTVFCSLCYITRRDQKRSFGESEIKEYIRRALNISEFKMLRSDDYLYDLTNVTCLLKKDGLDYEFIHESVVHYFSSLFIKMQTEENAKTFYTNRESDWQRYDGELMFLATTDRVRYLRYYLIPSLEGALNSRGNLKKHIAREVFSSSLIATRGNGGDFNFDATVYLFVSAERPILRILLEEEGSGFLEDKMSSFLTQYLKENSGEVKRLEELYKSKRSRSLPNLSYCKFSFFVEEEDVFQVFYKHFMGILSPRFRSELEKAKKIVSTEESKESLFS